MAVSVYATGSGVWRADATIPGRIAVGVVSVGNGSGEIIAIKTYGIITQSDWTAITGTRALASKGIYYVAADGTLTTVPSAISGTFIQQIGSALSSTKLSLDIRYAIRN
jgi:hypothetical protein